MVVENRESPSAVRAYLRRCRPVEVANADSVGARTPDQRCTRPCQTQADCNSATVGAGRWHHKFFCLGASLKPLAFPRYFSSKTSFDIATLGPLRGLGVAGCRAFGDPAAFLCVTRPLTERRQFFHSSLEPAVGPTGKRCTP